MMMNKGTRYFIWLLMFPLMFSSSCRNTWLEAKPDKSLVVPNTIKDYQALLDNTSTTFNIFQASGLAEMAAGDFYITNTSWLNLFSIQEKSAYIWEQTSKFYNGEASTDWVESYKRILNANVILEGIEKIKPAANEQQEWNNVKGSALFLRAFDFFHLAQEYCKSYVASTAITEMGLPLRLEYNVNIQVKRSTLQQTYDQIIKDLDLAVDLLGSHPTYKTRPSKQAVYALLARVYLAMENYDQAGIKADAALKIQSELLDFSKLNNNASYPVERFNTEVIFHSTFSYGIFNATRLIVEPGLFELYAADDYRKQLFFKSVAAGVTYRGNYSGDKNFFGGLATDELYLIRAESKARNGDLPSALADLNHLLKSRWKGVYTDMVSNDPDLVLRLILTERRKELIFRGIRWSDLRRLNRDSRFAVTLTRVLNGQTYTLLPNDKRYVFPIDEEELRLSGIQQNER
ncbi:RagB/SusD family nutrient uptake outer membrane protein [Pedobacter heparinus]|uniref:RagB/SusD domain protein n=1 Tax=Pedobacter heparinus (strain ATCC 13125 / DSM 2366 / CIP 104194 / JCM 7457 / NBRC 12017 / NCIMB 9290 / NRRL B-14731 / HIM 762-3) TaxID=485917 RepID=C6Y342_PEDHD|nr:RagB/SusD family nutrient uptake outer membrane protein [Pedobacter heparinus]ACU03255.1 conserved hypothetical protein [Pedobacter heparinus DSM 2366]